MLSLNQGGKLEYSRQYDPGIDEYTISLMTLVMGKFFLQERIGKSRCKQSNSGTLNPLGLAFQGRRDTCLGVGPKREGCRRLELRDPPSHNL